MKKNKLTYWIFGALILGIVAGALVNNQFANQINPDDNNRAAIDLFIKYTSLGSYIFLRLIKLIVAPLVLSTLVVGVAGIGDARSVGRMGIKTIGWFILASLMSLTLGLILVNLLEPGTAFATKLEAGQTGLGKT